jgi:hypothetical protein
LASRVIRVKSIYARAAALSRSFDAFLIAEISSASRFDSGVLHVVQIRLPSDHRYIEANRESLQSNRQREHGFEFINYSGRGFSVNRRRTFGELASTA